MPPYPGHVNFLVQTQQKLASEGKQVAVAFIEYSEYDSFVSFS